MRIQLLVPTRNRPANMQQIWETARRTATQKDKLSIKFYIDEDDYSSMVKAEQLGLPYHMGPRIIMSQMYNVIDDGVSEINWIGGDDIRFLTDRWDNKVRDEFNSVPDKLVFVYGKDGYNDKRLGTHPFISREWINTLGYVSPPYFSADYVDSWAQEISTNIGRDRFIDIETIHDHYITGRSQPDQTILEKNHRGVHDNMAQVFISLLPQRIADANKLCDKIGQPHVQDYKIMFP